MNAVDAYDQAVTLLVRGLERLAQHGQPWATYYPEQLAADCDAWAIAVRGKNPGIMEVSLRGDEFIVDSRTYCAVAGMCACWDCSFRQEYRAHRRKRIEGDFVYVIEKAAKLRTASV